MSWEDERDPSVMRVCIIRKLAAHHCENEIFSRESFLSWAVFDTILTSPEVPSTVSLTSCSAKGRELMKCGMRRGRLLRKAKGLNSGCAGSCSASVKPSKMGSPKESMRDLSSDWTTGSCWRLFKCLRQNYHQVLFLRPRCWSWAHSVAWTLAVVATARVWCE